VARLVPALWHAEIASVLRSAERRGRATEAQVANALGRLDALPIHTDQDPSAMRRAAFVALSREHGLAACDAACPSRRATPPCAAPPPASACARCPTDPRHARACAAAAARARSIIWPANTTPSALTGRPAAASASAVHVLQV